MNVSLCDRLTRPSSRPRHSTLSEARSPLHQHRFLQPNTNFSEFFEIYEISWLNFQFANLQRTVESHFLIARCQRRLGRPRRPSSSSQPPPRFPRTTEDQPRHSTLSEARSRLDRSRFSRPRSHFLAFFKIYKKINFSRANLANFC